MKTTLCTAALVAWVAGMAAIGAQADDGKTMVAEGGSDRSMEYQQQQKLLGNQPAPQDSSEGFLRMIREQPTAAGPASEDETEKRSEPKPLYRPPIQRDRELHGK